MYIKTIVFFCFLCGSKASQFAVFPNPTQNAVKCVEYLQNDTTFEERSDVLSCFFRAAQTSLFVKILCHAWNIHETMTFWQRSVWLLVTHNVFSCFPCSFKTSLLNKKCLEKIYTLAHNSVLLYKSPVFFRSSSRW